MEELLDFKEAIEQLGFQPTKLRLESFVSGANNYVVGLKYEDITWALSISFPKTKNISEINYRFEKDFPRLLINDSLDYLESKGFIKKDYLGNYEINPKIIEIERKKKFN